MRQCRFRALITLDPVRSPGGVLHPPAREYPSHTRALMILARPLGAGAGPGRLLPAEIWQDDDKPLRAGERTVVTARVSGEEVDSFLDGGQQFVLWSGGEVGHGTIYRKVYSDYGPS